MAFKKKKEEKPADDEEQIPQVGGVWKFIKYFSTKLDLFLFILGCVGAVIGGLAMPAFSFMFTNIIDSLNDPSPTALVDGVNDAALFGFVCGCVEFFVHWIFMGSFTRNGDRLLTRAREKVFEQVLHMELGWFEKHKPGTVSSYLTADLLKVKEGLGEKMGMCIKQLSTFIFSIAYGFYASWRLTLIMMAMFPLLILSSAVAQLVLTRLTEVGNKAYGRANDVTTEVLSSIRTIASFNGFERALERFATALKPSTAADSSRSWVQGFAFGFVFLLLYNVNAIAFYYGSYLIEWGHNTGGEILGCFFSVLMGAMMLGGGLTHFGILAELRAVTNKVFDTIERVPLIKLNNPSAEQFPVIGKVEFRGLTFRYPSRQEQLIFKRLDLTIEPGMKLALVGNSGSGKSSLLGLVERMYDPEEGDVFVDGRRLRDLDLAWWRDNVGIVMQEPVLFSGSIKENIRMGCRAPVTDEQIVEACKKANIYDTIMGLPETFDTEVGDGGSQLSGGQRQRICIARAIVKNPKILLLDEATSALDRGSEMVVQKALDAAMAGRTTLIIAHRLVTIRNADAICFIKPPARASTAADLGQTPQDDTTPLDHTNAGWSTIAEMGSHTQLMANNGPYAEMVNAQAAAEKSTPQEEQQQQHDKVMPISTNGSSVLESPRASMDLPRPHDTSITSPAGPSGQIFVHPHAIPQPGSPQLNPLVGERRASAKVEEQKYETKLEVDAEVPDPKKAGLGRVMRMSLPEWPWLLFGLIGAVVGGAIQPVMSILMTEMTTTFFKPVKQMREDVPFWCGMFSLIGAIAGAAFLSRMVGFGVAGSRLTERLRLKLYSAILRQEIGFFDRKENDSGALASVLSGDTTKVHQMFGPTIGTNTQNFVTLAAGLIIAFTASWRLTVVVLAVIPVLVFASTMNVRLMTGLGGGDNKIFDQSNQVVVESVSGVKTVMAINLQPLQIQRYTGYMEAIFKNCQRKAIGSGFFAGLTEFIFFGTFALAFWYGGQLMKDGKADFSQVMKAAMAVLMSASGMGENNAHAGSTSDARQASVRVFHYIDRQPKIDMDADGHVFNRPKGAISLQDVVFKYPSRPDTTILKKVSLEIEAGTQLALIGSTGCGKSTIIQMLERFYDPEQGRVLVDGVPVCDLQLKAWREHIGLVGQEPVLFDDTVEYNIKFGKPNASEEEMHEAAKVAQIHDVIMRLPEGYKTKVGLRGAAMSGGQRQRIAIARAVIKKPTLLLLDEATAALDNVSEMEVQKALDNVIQTMKMTVITVAHRLTTIANVDKIAVLHQGLVIEHGSHEELYALGGEYKARYDAYHGTGASAAAQPAH